jgi:prevent-host-death family protein
MKRTTVRELRNNYTRVLAWVSAGQEVQVTRRGKVVAKVVPPESEPSHVDWSASAAFRLSRNDKPLSAGQSATLLKDSQGHW